MTLLRDSYVRSTKDKDGSRTCSVCGNSRNVFYGTRTYRYCFECIDWTEKNVMKELDAVATLIPGAVRLAQAGTKTKEEKRAITINYLRCLVYVGQDLTQ